MSETVILLLVVGLLLALLIIRVPVAFALAISGLVGIGLIDGFEQSTVNLGRIAYSSVAKYGLIVIPMYVLMGLLAQVSGLGQRIFDVLSRYLAPIPGGVAIACIAAMAGFGAISGSSLAAVATLGPIVAVEMRRHGYADHVAAGVIAASGTLGVMIPPSIGLVVLATAAELSVGQLLIAGIVPGIISAVVYGALAMKIGYGRATGTVGKDGSERSEEITAKSASLRSKPASLPAAPRSSWSEPEAASQNPSDGSSGLASMAAGLSAGGVLVRLALLSFAAVGGFYSGWFTVTESSAVAALAALVMALQIGWRRPRIAIAGAAHAIRGAVGATSMIFMLLVGAAIFTYFLLIQGAPRRFAEWAVGLQLPSILVIVIFMGVLVALGMLLDSISIMLITAPFMFPVVAEFGFEGIWFGILVIKSIEIGLVTPPVGMNCFVLSGAVRSLKVETVFRGVLPFLAADVVTLLLLMSLPEVVMWLPTVMG